MIRSRQQAQADLKPREVQLWKCVVSAWEDYDRAYASLKYRHSRRTQASIIHDLMVSHVKESFDGVKGVTWQTERNLFLLNIDNKYLIKLKKLDRKLRSRNVQTQMVLDFLTQHQLELPGTPEAATNLQLGYQSTITESGQPKVWITCPDGSRVEWIWELSPELADVVEFPAAEPEEPEDQRRARPRSTTQDNEKTDDQEETPEDEVPTP